MHKQELHIPGGWVRLCVKLLVVWVKIRTPKTYSLWSKITVCRPALKKEEDLFGLIWPFQIPVQCFAPACIFNTSKWKQSVPDCIPLSSCLIDSSTVVTLSDWPADSLSPCDWPVSVRAGGNCSRGATRPGPGTQGRFKAVINIHREKKGAVRSCIACCFSSFVSLCHTHTHRQTDTHLYAWWVRPALGSATLCWRVWTWQPGCVCVQRCLGRWWGPPGLPPGVWVHIDLPANGTKLTSTHQTSICLPVKGLVPEGYIDWYELNTNQYECVRQSIRN